MWGLWTLQPKIICCIKLTCLLDSFIPFHELILAMLKDVDPNQANFMLFRQPPTFIVISDWVLQILTNICRQTSKHLSRIIFEINYSTNNIKIFPFIFTVVTLHPFPTISTFHCSPWTTKGVCCFRADIRSRKIVPLSFAYRIFSLGCLLTIWHFQITWNLIFLRTKSVVNFYKCLCQVCRPTSLAVLSIPSPVAGVSGKRKVSSPWQSIPMYR